MKKLIALLAGLIFTVHLTSCTSSDSKEESPGDEAVAESTAGTDGDLENLDAPPADGAAATADAGASEGFLDEQLPEDALGESNKQAAAEPTAEAPPSDSKPADTAAAPELGDTGTPPPPLEEPKSDALADAGPPPPPPELESVPPLDAGSAATAGVDPGTSSSFGMSDTSSAGTVASSEKHNDAPPAEAKPKASLKKVRSAPFTQSGILLNAVYVARKGDDYKKISKMIYGDSKKVKDLKKANPAIGSVKVGDKVYYNSPARPTDDTKLLTFYEDSGMVPEVYVAQEGDTMKGVAEKVLGNKNAWKELWVTNAVESKDAIPAGTELRYWKSAPAPAPVAEAPATPPAEVAMNNNPPAEQAAQPMPDLPPPPPPAEMAPPPAPPVAQNEIPPPPPAEMAPPPPPPPAEMPPPPPAEAVNPPPPPPMPKKTPGKDFAATDGGMDNDMVMTIAGAGIILAGLAAIILIRRRRQNRDMASAFNDTQVGT